MAVASAFSKAPHEPIAPPVPDARRAEIERMVDQIEDVTDVGQIAKLMVSDG